MEMPFLFHGNWAWASTIHWPPIKIIRSALPERDRYRICRTTYCRPRATLPLDASLNLTFYDANWNTILVKDLGLMESGIPDANGIIVGTKCFRYRTGTRCK